MRPTIDLVLDHASARTLLREAVADCRPDVLVHASVDAVEAAARLRDGPTDLVLLELVPGDAWTFAALDRLRAVASAPCVLLTHALRPRDVVACAGRGCLLLAYPDGYDGLVELMRGLLERCAPTACRDACA